MILRTEDFGQRRPVLVDVWYPASPAATELPYNYGLGHGHVAVSADAADSVWPVIVLSHGAFGAARNYSWIAEHLARHGYLVGGVSHYGESYLYGPETVAPASVLHPGLRPQDCSFVLDYLMSQAPFQRLIDAARIGALGHSSGGTTALALGGAVFDSRAMQQYCASAAACQDKGCAYARHAPPRSLPRPAAPRAYRDERVKAVVALDPALGPGYDARALSMVSVPVHVVGAVQNDFLPFVHHAGRFARLIPGASLTQLTQGEGHFIFLDECDADLEAHGVPLCRDRAGVHRARVHAHLTVIIQRFFDTHLRAP